MDRHYLNKVFNFMFSFVFKYEYVRYPVNNWKTRECKATSLNQFGYYMIFSLSGLNPLTH